MNLDARIECLQFLGDFLKAFLNQQTSENLSTKIQSFRHYAELASQHNPWFTPENITFCLQQWSNNLNPSSIQQWLSAYDTKKLNHKCPKQVLIIAAGNIPLVSLHDVISVFVCGHKTIVKLSSKDKHLLKGLIEVLTEQYPECKNYFTLTEDKVTHFDAVIATGSSQTLPYFEYYFAKKPHIFRSHRNSIAILTGNETKHELEQLSNDIFRYFGLGCRNVSKIYVPEHYNFEQMLTAFKPWEHIFYHHYYLNNYEYQKTIYLLNKEPFIDGGFFMLKENSEISSPIGVIFYEYYSELRILVPKIESWLPQIQCIVSKENKHIKSIPFGTTQMPYLWNYADDIDVINFLTQL
ncbi:MAG: hypothetical protein N2449_09925 [Bacteroidales bacterium]|nr:hypothetical protein [Bacteroidales bacterium]